MFTFSFSGMPGNGVTETKPEYCKLLICVTAVEECDARDDDSSNAAGIKKIK